MRTSLGRGSFMDRDKFEYQNPKPETNSNYLHGHYRIMRDSREKRADGFLEFILERAGSEATTVPLGFKRRFQKHRSCSSRFDANIPTLFLRKRISSNW